MKPNIVLIMVDQMRGDCLGVKGHPVVETPNLDMMARDGVLFTHAYTATPSCIPARVSLLTGMTQRSHGRVGYQDKIPWNYAHTLPGELAKAGYHTHCAGKMHVYPTRSLMGFHSIDLHDGYFNYYRNFNLAASQHWDQCDDYTPWLKQQVGFSADIIDNGLECNSWVARPWSYPEHLHPTNWVVTKSVEFLRKRDPGKPFFLKMSFVRPHSPLDPPQAYYDQYINQDIPLPPVGDWADTEDLERNGLYIDCQKGIIDRKALKRARAAYYALITHIDHQIGRFLQVLKEYRELNNTVIIFTSDHGDLLGDHNLFRKALPYEGCTSIPFIVYDPGKLLGLEQGTTCGNPVELRDIMPTLLDIAGVDIPECVEGKSVKPLLEGRCSEWRGYIHGEHSYGKDSNHFIVSSSEKYIWYSQTGKEQYFDLQNDPEELHDLVADMTCNKRVEYWRNVLIKELEGREEGYSDGKQLIVGQKPKNCLQHIL